MIPILVTCTAEEMVVRGRLACLLYRVSSRAHAWGIPFLPRFLFHLNAVLHGCEIHYKARIGRGFVVAHPCGVVIGQSVNIGDYCSIYSGVVLGVHRTGEGAQPKLGRNVIVYWGAKIPGPVTVGDCAVIGANAVVTDNVPTGTWMAGVPAKTIRMG
jgi:serine O-acetyltransferase